MGSAADDALFASDSSSGQAFGKLFIELDADSQFIQVGDSRIYFEPPKRHGKRRPANRKVRFRVEAPRSIKVGKGET